MTTQTREIHLARRPRGWPSPDDFRLVETTLPDPAEGQVVVRNTVMSVDPYMRGRMNDVKSYVPPFQLDQPLDGGAVGEVVASTSPDVPVGATVLHQLGWREHALLDATAVRVVDVSRVEASAYLGVLGMPGMTAYVGLKAVAGLKEGDTVFVSGAAGAVGSVAGQLARLLGAGRVIGSAGSPEKVAWLKEIGFDDAFDYHDGPVAQQLKGALGGRPIDVYFDNVGGDHLEGALLHMADFGRVAMCGAISAYNEEQPPPGPRTIALAITRRLTLRGFIVTDHADLAGEFYRTVGGWLAEGRIRTQETVVDGLDHAVEAFLDLHRGANTGKMLVRL